MNDILELGKNVNKNIRLNNDLSLGILNNQYDFDKIVNSVLRRGIEYCAKAINIDKENVCLSEPINKIVKGNQLKEIVNCAINASINQAVENNKGKLNKLDSLNEFKDMSLKGGLRLLLSAGMEILFSKVTKLNLFKPILDKLLINVKEFILSNSFLQKINHGVKKIISKKEEFSKICKGWYESYNNLDMIKINEYANKLESLKKGLANNVDCIKENNIIQNMTKLVNLNKSKLSNVQMQVCKTM